MGDVIRRTAKADDIMADISATHTKAIAKGGIWKSLAEEKLGPIVTILATVTANLKAADEVLAPLEEAIKAFDIKADKFIGEKSDIIWNKLDRPANDPAFSIMFPGGIAVYTDGSNDEQPDRMDLFAELLEAGVHPRLDATLAKEIADETRAMAADYRTKVDAVRGPRAKAALLEKVKIAVARSGQIELASLKRRWLAERFSEAEIHTVIPDRPPSKPAPKQDT
jgi:hypothetical protein